MSKISEMSILYGPALIARGPSPETVKAFAPDKPEPTVEDVLLTRKDEELAILVRLRGERAFFEGDESLAKACRDLWQKLTGRK
jgi:hypothetical protein